MNSLQFAIDTNKKISQDAMVHEIIVHEIKSQKQLDMVLEAMVHLNSHVLWLYDFKV